ncbi:hypothetical protein M422DRAFT_269466 [Sphaerobolus stellatus SS14]|uniref:Uncharacterized protein n=1 Tax=Sphaerobolus stellatus (strain SS14) TaxID=990650 RepID=A0A0C9TI51_SPHS4|nr:hypothetical protein M422DRAFT_269466 [Sphaerobolus stellatus SS14]
MSSEVVFLAGSSSGIGLVVARLFHREGWNVVEKMRTPEKAPSDHDSQCYKAVHHPMRRHGFRSHVPLRAVRSVSQTFLTQRIQKAASDADSELTEAHSNPTKKIIDVFGKRLNGSPTASDRRSLKRRLMEQIDCYFVGNDTGGFRHGAKGIFFRYQHLYLVEVLDQSPRHPPRKEFVEYTFWMLSEIPIIALGPTNINRLGVGALKTHSINAVRYMDDHEKTLHGYRQRVQDI